MLTLSRIHSLKAAPVDSPAGVFIKLVPPALLLPSMLFAEATLDRPPREDEVDYAPADEAVSSVNPPPFVWLPLENVDSYLLQLSRSEDFPPAETSVFEGIPRTVHVLDKDLEPGEWYWRYGYQESGEIRMGRPRPFSIAEDAVSLPFPGIEEVLEQIPKSRPRVYFSKETLAGIRENPEGRFRAVVNPVIRDAEAVLKREEPLFPEPKPWEEYEDERQVYVDTFREMRPYTRGMEICARAYLFTGDERFAEEARRRLMHFMTWDVDGPSSVFPPTELGMDIAEHAPRTFDWIYDFLSEEEREKCLDVLAQRIAQVNEVHRGRPFESRPFSSHPGRMVGFAVEGSLVLAHDVPEAADWLEYTLRLLWSVYPAWGGEDGGWHEGVSYWSSYMRRIFQVVTDLDRLGIPLKEKPFFRNTGWFGLYAAYPGRPQRSFGDGYERGVGRGFGHLLYTLSSLYGNPYWRWYAEETGGGPTGPAAAAVMEPEIDPKAPKDLPQSRLFTDVGWVAMHSEMGSPGDNVMLLMQSSPFGSLSHNHANQNAFVLEAFGEALAISSGYYHAYGDAHHSEWVWQTRAHNSILVDGEGQTPRSREARGKIIAYEENDDWCYAAGDATEAYDDRLGKFVRHTIFVRPGYFVIIDELESAGDDGSRFDWLLHAMNEIAIDEDNRKAIVSSGDARLRLDFLQPSGLEFEQTTGWDPQPARPGDAPPQFHFTASMTGKEPSPRFVSLLFPHRAGYGGDLPEPRLLEADGGIAVEVGDDLILWKEPDAGKVRSGEWETEEAVEVFRKK